MNTVEIEEAVSELAAQPFDAIEFPFSFLEAFGNKSTTIKKLRSGSSNKTDVDGAILQRNIFISVLFNNRFGNRQNRDIASDICFRAFCFEPFFTVCTNTNIPSIEFLDISICQTSETAKDKNITHLVESFHFQIKIYNLLNFFLSEKLAVNNLKFSFPI